MKIITKMVCFVIMITATHSLNAQSSFVRGTVKGNQSESCSDHEEGHDHEEILPFANVYWANTNHSVTADEKGKFVIARPSGGENKLVFSYVGYASDTVLVDKWQEIVNVILKPNTLLNTVEISEDKDGNYISKIKPIKTEVISEAGLQKLACCNLSESFEGTATVDVGYADAVSGAKRIQMLGLSGIYSQLMMENIPVVRGLSAPYGLSFIPGPWMQSIQISKGTSAVINGYESISGQINIEYKKPEHTPERFYLNIYGNSDGKTEANILSKIKVNEKLSTMIMAHGSYNPFMIDHNKDSFLDMPTGWTGNFMNRWSYEQQGKMHAQFGISFVQDDKQGGQKEYYKVAENLKPDFYNINIDARHYNAFLKSGFFLNDQGYKSIGLIASADRHEIYSNYGKNKYNGIQHTAYMNILYQSVFGNTNHKFTTGASFMFDNYSETLNDSLWERTEFVPGAFFQYTFSMPEKLSVILGFRADYNTAYGLFITPRIHVKYDFDDLFSLRASAGKGYRTPNFIAENIQVLATSRSIYVDTDISVEKAWNYGLNFTKEFLISEDRRASIGLDFYHTGFINQLVVDFDKNPQEVHFYNLEGRSFSNSLQADFMIQPFNRFEITLAGRYNHVKKTINGVFRESPYVSKYKALSTLSYATKHNKWKFDVSAQYNGPQRLPSTASNPEIYRRKTQSPGFFMLHAQITKKFKFIEIYAGAENLTGYTQHQPIIAAEEPFGKYFDASMIWGPVMGRTFYAGIRLSIK